MKTYIISTVLSLNILCVFASWIEEPAWTIPIIEQNSNPFGTQKLNQNLNMEPFSVNESDVTYYSFDGGEDGSSPTENKTPLGAGESILVILLLGYIYYKFSNRRYRNTMK